MNYPTYDLTLNRYQERARTTAVYPGMADDGDWGEPMELHMGLVYCSMKLAGEAGEVAEKVAKIMRDNDCVVDLKKRMELCKELGDVLWYVAMSASELGLSLEHVAEENLSKLKSRKDRGKIQGSGDNR